DALGVNSPPWVTETMTNAVMHAIILANAPLSAPLDELPPHDLLVAANGGARHAFRAGMIPDAIIGDMDSLAPDEAAGFERAGASLFRYPADKDETDLELALDFAVRQRATEITLYGLFGGRWDMTFANLLLLPAPKYAGVRLRVVEGDTEMYILRGGEALTLPGRPGDTVSVIPLGGDAVGLAYRGLEWPLEDAMLPFGTPRGVSNRLLAEEAIITLQQGVILCIIAHKCPIYKPSSNVLPPGTPTSVPGRY
ncbi:MAG: thiamine diphosphokinase, partial [Anaerolineales bacterium]